jgi:hypothetical protein
LYEAGKAYSVFVTRLYAGQIEKRDLITDKKNLTFSKANFPEKF